MRQEETHRVNSLTALRKRQQQEEEERRREQEYKARLEEIHLSQQTRYDPEVAEEILDDAERRWRQDRQERMEFQVRLLAEFERHNHALELLLSRLTDKAGE